MLSDLSLAGADQPADVAGWEPRLVGGESSQRRSDSQIGMDGVLGQAGRAQHERPMEIMQPAGTNTRRPNSFAATRRPRPAERIKHHIPQLIHPTGNGAGWPGRLADSGPISPIETADDLNSS